MSVVTMPLTLRCGRGCKVEQITVDAVGVSDPAGSAQARSYGMPRWALSLVSPQTLDDAAAGVWKAMLLGLRGSVNVLAAYDPSRPVPLGTLRGAPTLAVAAAYGDTTAQLDCPGQVGRTVRVGDWLQLGTGWGTSQLVLVMADATVDGAARLALTFTAPLRRDFTAGTAVAWDHPVSYYRRAPGRTGWAAYSGRRVEAMSVDLVEAWNAPA